jgi:phosphoglycerate-specific signal transduction histidine kinase
LLPNKLLVQNTFIALMKVTTDHVRKEQVYNNLMMNALEVNKFDFAYLIMRLFRISGDIEKLPYKKLFDILEKEADPIEIE